MHKVPHYEHLANLVKAGAALPFISRFIDVTWALCGTGDNGDRQHWAVSRM